jgi:hypothetical protein
MKEMNHSKVTSDLPGGEEMQPCLSTTGAKAQKSTTIPINSEASASTRTPKTFIEKVIEVLIFYPF